MQDVWTPSLILKLQINFCVSSNKRLYLMVWKLLNCYEFHKQFSFYENKCHDILIKIQIGIFENK